MLLQDKQVKVNRNPESRVLDIFGPNLVIESNGNVGVGGALHINYIQSLTKGMYINKHFMLVV